MLALVTTPGGNTSVELREVAEPEAAANEAIIEVRAFSLNRGALSQLATHPQGWRPGQDIAGVIVQSAADGSGPQAGSCVVALVDQAWKMFWTSMKKPTIRAILPSAQIGKLITLHADVRAPQKSSPGQPERIDYEYERLGTANLFFMVEPLAGWHHVEMTERRTKLDYAECIRWLVNCAYPEAEYLRIVQDNLNIHTPAALYEAFPPEEARRILRRVEFHYTRHPRQLVEYGRNRDQHFPEGLFLSPGRLSGNAASAYQHAGTHTQPGALFDLVAVYDERGSSEIAPPVSRSPKRTEDAGVRRGSRIGSTHVTYNEMNPGA